MGFSYLPFITCVTEDDSVPEHKCKWLSLLSFQSSILQELQPALLMLWIILLFRILSLLFSSCFRNRESLLFLNSIPSTTSRSHILLRETVAIISYPTSIERNRQQTERASIWRFTRFSRNVLFVKWSQNKTQPCVLFADEITKRWNGLCSSYSVTNSMISISIHVHDKNARAVHAFITQHILSDSDWVLWRTIRVTFPSIDSETSRFTTR